MKNHLKIIYDSLWREVTEGSSDTVVKESLNCITSMCTLISKVLVGKLCYVIYNIHNSTLTTTTSIQRRDTLINIILYTNMLLLIK